MIYLSQYDPKWGKAVMRPSNLTLAKAGCTTTCISMLSDYFGCYVPPDKMIGHEVKYTKTGLIIWNTAQFPKFKFVKRGFGRDDVLFKQALKDPNQAVIFNVNGGAHWVVGASKQLLGKDYNVIDPWGGVKCQAIKKYYNIVGYALFSKT
jgi:hypothetical protein